MNTMKKLVKRLKREKDGLATIETALVIGLLVLLTFGVMEYGWMFYRMAQVNNVARSGAREAILPDASDASVQSTVSSLMAEWDMGGSGYSLSVTPGGIDQLARGEHVYVTVEVPYANVQLMGLPIFPLPENLTATAAMAKEGPN